MKKLIFLLITLLVLMGAMTVSSFAVSSDCVMTVDGVEYTSFEEGWNAGLKAASKNDDVVQVVMYADWKADANGKFGSGNGFKADAIYISEDTEGLTLDMNGHTIDRGLFVWNDFEQGKNVSRKKDSGEVMHIDSGSEEITIKNGIIRGACNYDYGGVYIDKADVVFDNVEFVSNYSEQGGALYNNEGNVDFVNCKFKLNYSFYGGAVYSDYDTVDFYNCVFEDNFAIRAGGAIFNYDAEMNISGSKFIRNQAGPNPVNVGHQGCGGAICSDSGDLEVNSCEFNNNIGDRFGGVFYHDGGDFNVKNSTFTGNTSYNSKEAGVGGVAYIDDVDGTGKFTNCKFNDNSGYYTGAFYINDTMIFDNCTFEGNKSITEKYKRGSLMTIEPYGDVTLKNCTAKNNTGGYLIDITSVLNPGKLRLDGVVNAIDNFDRNGNRANIVCSDHSTFYSYIELNEGFSKDSVIGISAYDTYSVGDTVVDNIPDGWSTKELVHTFRLDENFVEGGSTSDYYLEKDGDELIFNTGNINNSIVEILKKETPQPEPQPQPEPEPAPQPEPSPSTPVKPSAGEESLPETEINEENITDSAVADDEVVLENVTLDEYYTTYDDNGTLNAGSVIGEGSMTTIIILLAVCVIAVGAVCVVVKKKKN